LIAEIVVNPRGTGTKNPRRNMIENTVDLRGYYATCVCLL